MLGERVAGRFELEELAQAGGMGAVYRARDLESGERVAVKLLRSPGTSHDARFQREAALLADLRHPAIVRHVAHGRTPGGDLYLVMEWLDGEDLARRLTRGPLPPGDALALLRRAGEGLALLHARGGVHRDLKPGNLFLVGSEPREVKILDFGIARAAAAAAITHTGVLMGTPGYTAPEQARGAREIDARVDVYALGCVLFECLAGRPAFAGEHVMAVLAKILLEEPPRLSELAPELAPELDALVQRLLAKDPERRPADAAELVSLIDAVASGPAGQAQVSAPTPRPPTLGSDEQRFMTLIVCADGKSGSVAAVRLGQLPTLADTPLPGAAPEEKLAVDPTVTPSPDRVPEAVALLVKAHGARLEPLADGSWVIGLGRPATRAPATDQAAQAARLALALKRQLPGARVALASGRGITAGRLPVGEVIDRAVALLGPTGEGKKGAWVGIDELTAELTGERFVLAGERGARRLVAEAEESTPARRLLGKPTPFVGRDRELATLAGIFEECAEEPTARAVLVRAPAGYGKSRLREELLRQLGARGHRFELRGARGEPMRAGAPFAMAAQLVRRAAGILDGELLARNREKLHQLCARVLAGEDLTRVEVFLGELADVPAESGGRLLEAARRDAMLMGDQMRCAFEDWLAAESRLAPVLLVLEDLHLGDLSTVKLFDSLLRNLRDRPVMLLALARPEVQQIFPGLWAERQLQELPLGELGRRAAHRLCRQVLGARADDATVERVVAQAGGNAFYLEELCRVLVEGHGQKLPGTVLAMAQARLEALPADARRLLRAASIYGDRFTAAGVLALLGDDADRPRVDALVAELVEREVIEPRPPVRFHNQAEFAFRHALVREAAHAMLTDADRALGNRLAAEWLEAAGVSDPALLAEHWAQGGLLERAVAGWLRAARDALEGNDLQGVLANVERGLAAGARGEALGELLYLRAEAHRWRGDFTAAAEAGSLALAALSPGGEPWWGAAQITLTAQASLQQYDRLLELTTRLRRAPIGPDAEAARVRALAKAIVQLFLAGRYDPGNELLAALDAEVGQSEPADPAIAARVYEARAFAAGARSDQGACLSLLSRAAAAYLRAGDLRNASMVEGNLGYTFMQLGAYEEAARRLEGALADGERLGLALVSAVVLQNLGLTLAHLGDTRRAIEVERSAMATFKKQQDLHMAGVSSAYLAIARLFAGDAEGALRDAEAALELVGQNAPARALALAVLARARLARGRQAEALSAAREAYALLESLGGLDEGEGLVRLAHAEALVAAGRTDEARAVARVAVARLEELAAKLDDDALAACFRERVPEHAALRAIAARLG